MHEKARAFAVVGYRTKNSPKAVFVNAGGVYLGATLEEAMRLAENFAISCRATGNGATYEYKSFGGMFSHTVQEPERALEIRPISRD